MAGMFVDRAHLAQSNLSAAACGHINDHFDQKLSIQGLKFMGLDYSFLLYFKQEMLWEALQGVAQIAYPTTEPTTIQLPDRTLSLPFQNWHWSKAEYSHKDLVFYFATVLVFAADEYIIEYIHELDEEDELRAPPDDDGAEKYLIGNIFLHVYADLRQFSKSFPESDLVALDFFAASTDMGLLFEISPSMRRTFISLLASYGSVGGLLNIEYDPRVFWWGDDIWTSACAACTFHQLR